MIWFVGKRFLLSLPTIVVPVLLVFLLLRLAPGDPAAVLLGGSATPHEIAALRERLGLDKPLIIQFWLFAKNMFQFDLGTSIFSGASVSHLILSRGGVTLELLAFSLVIAVVIGVPAGIYSAIHRNRTGDKVTMFGAVLGVAIPSFWLALMLILFLSVKLGWFPASGYVPISHGLLASLHSLTLPAFSLGIVQAAFIARLSRSAILDVLTESFPDTARYKGLAEHLVLGRHVFRAAMVPVVTAVGLTAIVLISTDLAVEKLFAIPGIGSLMVEAVARRDYPIIQGAVLVIAIAYVLINLVTDIVYAAVDPRVREQ